MDAGGFVFFRTERHDAVVAFYAERLDFGVWRDQPDCTILERDGFRVGFCDRDRTDDCGIVTVVVDSRASVDEAHEALRDVAEGAPRYEDRYGIYHFFAADPDGRAVELQQFE
jgi:hypothetical protein